MSASVFPIEDGSLIGKMSFSVSGLLILETVKTMPCVAAR